MDPHHFDPFNVAAWQQVQQAVSEEPQTGETGQFERQLAQASQAAPVASEHRATSYPHDVQPSVGETPDARARSNLLPSEGVLINDEHDEARSRAAKGRRAPPDLEEVVIYRQSSATATSGESSGAPQVVARGVIVRGHSDNRPLYSEDAAVLELEQALLKGGMHSRTAHEHETRLINYSRWLFENNLPGIVARLDSKSLIADGAIHTYGGSTANLLKSLGYFRTFRATGELVLRRGRPSAKRDSSSQSVPLNAESPVQMEQRRIDASSGRRGPGHPQRGPGHPQLPMEDRNLIDSAMAKYVAQENPKPRTVRNYAQALRRLAKDLRARGQTTNLADHESLLEHATTYFPKDRQIKGGLSVLRAHDTYPNLSKEDRDLIDSVMSEYTAQKKRKPKTVRRYTQALRELGNNFRARGQATNLADHASLLEHATTYFPNNARMTAVVRILRTHVETYPHLSMEDRNHIDSAIAQYAAQETRKPRTVRRYTQALRRLVNDLRARGHTTDLAEHEPLLKHAAAYLPEDRKIKAGLSILRAYHDPNHLVSRGRPRAASSAKDASDDVQQSLGERPDARAMGNLLPSDGVLMNHEHDIAQSRAAKRQRTLINPPPGNVALVNPESAVMPSAVSDPPEELQRPQNQLHDDPHGPGHNHPALSSTIDPQEFTSDREPPSPEELLAPLDEEQAEKLQEERDDQRSSSAFMQEQTASCSGQLPRGELRRVLDHLENDAMPSAASVAPEEIQRLEKQLHDELRGLGNNHPALSFSIEPEEFTFDLKQFSPGELQRLLDEEPAEELQEGRDDHPPM
ncbi:hypothetical protein [Bradyrhizobium sp. USDA 4473]